MHKVHWGKRSPRFLKLPSLLVLFFIALSPSISTYCQAFSNLDFSKTCDSSKTGLCNWDLSWGAKNSVMQDRESGIYLLKITGSKKNDVSFTEQSLVIEPFHETRIMSVTADMKIEDVEGKGAGLDIQAFDASGNLLGFRDMGGLYSLDWLQGTKAWINKKLSWVIPEGTTRIKIGAILYGKGIVWYRNYKVNFVTTRGRKPSGIAYRYIHAVIDTIRKHSIYRDSLNLDRIEQTAMEIAGPANEYNDCYLAVQYLIDALRPAGDEHSFFMTPAEYANLSGPGSLINKIENPVCKMVGDVAYLFVPPFHGTNSQRKLEYSDSLQSGIRQLMEFKPKGWIVDLRQNTGGDMEPMVVGLGPLFTNEKLGALVDVENIADYWHYNHGKYFWDDGYSSTVSHFFELTVHLPIAVLISNQTGSSGEAVAISFVGNNKTRFFGQPTWGLTTGNGSFDLVDGANIHLASTTMADRHGKKFSGPLQPDVMIENNQKEDLVLKAAVNWILGQ
jgi:carboxyl-terminal processing protease